MPVPRLGSGSRRAARGWEPLSTDWNVEAEARSFLVLVRSGEASLAGLEREVRMTDAERAALQSEYPEDAADIARIQRSRARTWDALLGMLTAEDRAREADAGIEVVGISGRMRELLSGLERGDRI